jgi:hypothetical protein
VAAAAATAACSTTYSPQRSGRVAMVVEGGSLAFVRDGRTYPLGLLGGGLADAVACDPEAVEHAHAYTRDMAIGLISTIAGVAALAGDLAYASVPARAGAWPQPVDLGILGAGAVAAILGDIFLDSAQPNLYDAINIYNDHVGASAGAPAVGPCRDGARTE